MTYDLVKERLVRTMGDLGYTESSKPFVFSSASANEFDRTFIVKAVSGENDEDNSETLSNRFYDIQKWQILLAFAKSELNDIINRDDLHRKKDSIINEIDDPTNWVSNVRIQKYISWEVEELENYYLLTIGIKVIDTYIYT